MNDFRLQIVAVILAATPKSAKHTVHRVVYTTVHMRYLPNLTYPSSVSRILAPYSNEINFIQIYLQKQLDSLLLYHDAFYHFYEDNPILSTFL